MSNKKNSNSYSAVKTSNDPVDPEMTNNDLDSFELNDDEMYIVTGGTVLPGHPGDMSFTCKCWQCGDVFTYIPGENIRIVDDPWRHFCSPKCKINYENKYIRPGEDPRP